MTTLLIAEHDNATLKDATAKALTAAKQLGGDVHILVAGKGCKAVADAAAKLDGVKKVLLADAEPYAHQLAEPLAALVVSLAKDYDAIVTFRSDGRSAAVAFEYERSPKRTQDYERIAQELARERRVNAVVYATPTLQLAKFVAHGFRNAMHKVYVTVAHDFAADPAKAPLTDTRVERTVRVADLLS